MGPAAHPALRFVRSSHLRPPLGSARHLPASPAAATLEFLRFEDCWCLPRGRWGWMPPRAARRTCLRKVRPWAVMELAGARAWMQEGETSLDGAVIRLCSPAETALAKAVHRLGAHRLAAPRHRS